MDAEPRLAAMALSVQEAARVLGLGRTTVFALVSRGELASLRVGRRRLVPVSAIEAYLVRASNGPPHSDTSTRPSALTGVEHDTPEVIPTGVLGRRSAGASRLRIPRQGPP